MKTLKEFNQERSKQYEDASAKLKPNQSNEIQCPICGTELFDTNPEVLLLSNPPKKNVHCGGCDFKGYRIA